MTDVIYPDGDYYDGYEPDPDEIDDEADDDWYDDVDDREPDPEDYETAKAYEEHYEHCQAVHGGGECDCVPSPLELAIWRVQAAGYKLQEVWYRARYALRQPWTLRLLGAEVTVRLHPRSCGACAGRGWFYSKTGIDPLPMPPGYDGVSLCGCGTAIRQLADARRAVRQMRNEAPF